MDEIIIDKIVRSKRRTIALVVSADATLIVRAPMRVSVSYINDLVEKKRAWVLAKQKQVAHRNTLIPHKKFVNGEEFLYLGEHHPLKIGECRAITATDHLYFPEKYIPRARVKMIEWYKKKARDIITERVEHYSAMTEWKFTSIAITGAQKRWGSCGPKGALHFSWRLVMAPRDIIDYVVVHELAHIPERNHSAQFWNKVGMVLPDYAERKRWLREHGMKCTL
ncbi:MAG: M48 family metallopeptidase [Candidatus Azambacteria bacterium]|nr:M48 family metallopeptidase [Candidatus Azambacteria bacterium]